MDYFAKTFTNKLREHNVISSGEFNIYYYGFEILFSTTFTAISILLISCFINSFIFGLLYLFITMPLRSTLGGYHAQTYLRCYISSLCLYYVVSSLCQLLVTYNVPDLWLYILLILCSVHLFTSKPVQNQNHPVSDTVLHKNKKIANKFLIFYLFLIFLFLIITDYNKDILSFCILSITSISLLIIISKKGDK